MKFVLYFFLKLELFVPCGSESLYAALIALQQV